MKTYFIKKKESKSYLCTIYRNTTSTSNDEGDAIEFSSLEMAQYFLAKLKDIETPSSFEKNDWRIYAKETIVKEVF